MYQQRKDCAMEPWQKNVWRASRELSAVQTQARYIFFMFPQYFYYINFFTGSIFSALYDAKNRYTSSNSFDIKALLSHEFDV